MKNGFLTELACWRCCGKLDIYSGVILALLARHIGFVNPKLEPFNWISIDLFTSLPLF
jgi:hypothetical protein